MMLKVAMEVVVKGNLDAEEASLPVVSGSLRQALLPLVSDVVVGGSLQVPECMKAQLQGPAAGSSTGCTGKCFELVASTLCLEFCIAVPNDSCIYYLF